MSNLSAWEWAEWGGTIAGLLCVWLTAKRSLWAWPTGIVSVMCYFAVFWHARLYADTALQVVYLILSIYGWWHWAMHKNQDSGEVLPERAGLKRQWILAGITGVMFLLMAYVLVHYTDTDVPYMDALTTAISLSAQWLMAKKYIENWWWWITADILAGGLYIYKELYLTAVFFGVLCLMAYYGYREWKTKIDLAA